jgi:hypothetical protein
MGGGSSLLFEGNRTPSYFAPNQETALKLYCWMSQTTAQFGQQRKK